MNMRKNVILNTYGVFFFFFCQWALTIVVTRLRGYVVAGQYTLAVSFTNMFSFIGMFGMRGFQVSDVRRRYTDGQYYAFRLATCLIALAAFAVVLPLRRYNEAIVWCCVAMMAFKVGECLNDVVLGALQRDERFVHIAVTYTLKGILPAGAFAFCLWRGWTLPAAVGVMAAAFLLVLALYDAPRVLRVAPEERRLSLSGARDIFAACLPLMLASLLDSAMVYIPRDAVEKALGSEALGYYGTVSIVVVVLSTLGTGVWGSVMPRMSRFLAEKDWASARRLSRLCWLGMGVCAALVLLFGRLLGPFFFRLLFGEEILAYMYLLVPVLLNAVLLLVNSYFQCVFIPLGKRSVLLYTDLAAAAACAVLANLLVRGHGILGACLGLTISLALRTVLLLIAYFRAMNALEKRG